MADASIGTPCPQCQTPLDSLGDHAVCCMHNFIGQRHVALQDSLMGLVQGVGMSCRREVGPSGTRQRPGDLLIPRWDCNGPAAIDLTIRHHQAPSGPWKDHSSGKKNRRNRKTICMPINVHAKGGNFTPFWWIHGEALHLMQAR